MTVRRAWLRRNSGAARGEDSAVEFNPQQISGLFAAPRWLFELGRSSWLLVGVTLFLAAAVWLLSATQTIVMPLITAAVVAAVASPLMAALERRGVVRGMGAALLLIAFIVLIVALVLVVLGGITSQIDPLRSDLDQAKNTISGWLADLGIHRDTANAARDDVSSAISSAVPALLDGLAGGLRRLSSLVVFIGLTLLSSFFLLKDGRLIRRWSEGHMRVPRDVAHGMNQRVLQSLRDYFVGVTFVAAFNGVVVG